MPSAVRLLLNLHMIIGFLVFSTAANSIELKGTSRESEASSNGPHLLYSQVENLFKPLLNGNSNSRSLCLIKWVTNWASYNSSNNNGNEQDFEYLPLLQSSSSPVILDNNASIPEYSDLDLKFMEFDNTTKNIPIGQNQLRFHQCRVQIITIQETNNVHDEYLYRFLRNQILNNENYDLYLFLTSSNLSLEARLQSIDSLAYVRGLSSPAFEIHNGEEINLICFRCTNSGLFDFVQIPNGEADFKNGEKSISKLSKIWFEHHKDRHGVKLHSTKFDEFPPVIHSVYSSTCHPYILIGKSQLEMANPEYLSQNLCIEMEMVHKYNFSFNYKSSDQEQEDGDPDIPYGFFQDGDILGHPSGFAKRETNTIFIDITPYRLLVLLDTSYIKERNIGALFSSLDSASWSFCCISILLLSICLIRFQVLYKGPKDEDVSNTKTKDLNFKREPQSTSSITMYIQFMIGIFGTLLLQGYTVPRAIIRSKSSLCLLVFGLWLLFTIVITNGYGAILASLMTRHTLPNYPKTLEEIVLMSYPTITLTTVELVNTTIPFKEFHYFYPDIIELYLNTTCDYCINIINSTIYPTALLSTSTVSEDFELLETTLLNGGDNPVFESLWGNKSLGRNFAMIEGQGSHFLKHLVISKLSKSKHLVKDGVISEFVYIRDTCISANYLYGLVHSAVRGLAECGILQKWKQIKEVSELLYYERVAKHKPGYGQIATKFIFQLPEDESRQPEKLDFDVLVIPLTVLGICVCISTIVFLMEMLVLAYKLILSMIIYDTTTFLL